MEQISITRVLAKLDAYFAKNDYDGAEKHLLYWLEECRLINDKKGELLITNELIGLYRKLDKRIQCLGMVQSALDLIERMNIQENVGAATTYLNCGTAYKALKLPGLALPLFEQALVIYERELPEEDARRGGLYNNMALTLADLHRFEDAYQYFESAIFIMSEQNLWLEVAITYMNIADTKVAELGLEASESIVKDYLNQASTLLDTWPNRDGYYAFVCEKCAAGFGAHGYFVYKDELFKRARDIYEGNATM